MKKLILIDSVTSSDKISKKNYCLKIFKILLDKLKTHSNSMWERIKNRPVEFIFNLFVFISAIVTIIQFFYIVGQAGFIHKQAELINKQLIEINEQGKIRVNFHADTEFGPKMSILNVRLVARNSGNKLVSYFRTAIIFCNDVKVIYADPLWHYEKPGYDFDSEKPVPPYFEGKLTFFSDALDSIGHFRIGIQHNSSYNNPVPFAIVIVSGNYPNPDSYLVSFTPSIMSETDSGFSYEELLDKDGKTIKDYIQTLNNCVDTNKLNG